MDITWQIILIQKHGKISRICAIKHTGIFIAQNPTFPGIISMTLVDLFLYLLTSLNSLSD